MSNPVTPTSEPTYVEKPPLTPDSPSEKDATVETIAPRLGQSEGEPQPHIHAKTFLAVAAVCLIYFAQLFALVGAGAQGQTIAGHFGRSGDVSWVVAPITIMTTVLGPIISQASDFWGRKWFLVVLTVLGAVGGAVVARASSMGMVIAGFSILGSAFGVQPLLHAVASEVIPRRWRSWAQATVSTCSGLGLVLGLIIGGALNRHGNPDGFRYYFYTAMAMFALSALICIFAYQPLPTKLQSELSLNEKLAGMDWVGYVLLSTSLVLFSLGLFWSKNPYAWSDPHVCATFAVGVVLGIFLVVYETIFRKDGMFHHGLFASNRNFTIALICIFCEGVAFFAVNVYLAFQIGVLYEKDVFVAGGRVAIGYSAALIASVVTGLYTAITKKVRYATFVAFIIFTLFFVCMATATKASSTHVWGYPVFMGWGIGMALVLLITVSQLSTPPELIATASGLIISVRSLGGTIGIAIYNAIFTSAMSHIGSNIAEAVIEAGLPPQSVNQFVGDLLAQNTTALFQINGTTPQIIGAGAGALLDTYALGFRNVWLAALAFIVLAAIASLFLFDPSKEFNNHIDAPVEKDEELYGSS